MNRTDILKKANEIIQGEREGTYGKPEDSFATIAQFWSTYLNYDISSVDVANMMVLLKVARNSGGVYKDDNWTDICGYAALGGEIQGRYTEENFGQYMNEPEESTEDNNVPYPFTVPIMYFHSVKKVTDAFERLSNIIDKKHFLTVRDYYKEFGLYGNITIVDDYYGWDYIRIEHDETREQYFIYFDEPMLLLNKKRRG